MKLIYISLILFLTVSLAWAADTTNVLINEQGQLVNKSGQLINDHGQLVDKNGDIIKIPASKKKAVNDIVIISNQIEYQTDEVNDILKSIFSVETSKTKNK